MKLLKTCLCLLLTLLTVLSCFTACGGNGQTTETDTDGQGTADAATDAPTAPPAETPTEAPTEPATDSPTVVLTFSPDAEGLADITLTVPASDATVTLPEDPTRAGYAFKGWYTDRNGAGDRVTCATVQDGNKTYYAKWTEAIDMSKRNRIVVGGFNGITEDVATEEDFAALAACGVDEIYMTWFHSEGENGRYSLEKSLQYMAWMEKYGIRCWYNDWELNEKLGKHAPAEECMALLSVYKDSPSYIGNYLQDEPSGSAFGDLLNKVNYFKELMPGYEMYINLIPNIASPSAFVEESFEKYVRAFVNDFPLSYVSQDFYPIDINGKKKIISNKYYESLYIEALAARDTGKEAWMYIYTMRDTVNAVKDYEPSLADVRFEAGTALAFGCCHLSYFCFDCPPSYARSESFAMIKNHERTPLFDVGVQITKEIKALSEVFPKYLWQEACYLGSGKIKRPATSAKMPAAEEVLPFAVTTEADLIIGIFDEANGDGCAYLFANNSDLNKPDETRTVSCAIAGAQKVIAHIGTEATELVPVDGQYTFTLSCGQFCFLEVVQ